MNFYDELTAEFSAASQHFKAGNHLLFFRDMTHKLSDLLFTKGEHSSLTETLHLLLHLFLTLLSSTVLINASDVYRAIWLFFYD